MAWHLRPVSPREEHQFYNLTDLFRWFRDWSRALPELAMPEMSTLEQLLGENESELASFVRADTPAETLRDLRERILRLGRAGLAQVAATSSRREALLVSSFLSGEAAFVRRFGDAIADARLAPLLEDSVARLEHDARALLVRREAAGALEAELLQWSPILDETPELLPLLERWLEGYLAKQASPTVRLAKARENYRLSVRPSRA